MREIYSVSKLNQYIKSKFDNDFALKGIRLEGEISNFKVYPSGHIYFSLKDENSSIKAVMFKDYTRYISSSIKDGDKVIALGYVGVYPQRGEYQFYAEAIEISGLGAELLKFEELKKKLFLEGLFDEARKRKINIFPKAVGVISAPNSAALADIKKNLLRRYPLVEVKLFPSLVQGKEAPKELLKALKLAMGSDIDTLIIGRGGGSQEDLSAFNDEEFVREAAKSKVPIISAVGHEIDFTLIDYIADKRASTPTGAAELAVIDKREIYQTLDRYENELDNSLNNIINNYKEKISGLKNRKIFLDPTNIYKEKIEKLENTSKKLDLIVNHLLEMYQNKIASSKKELESLSVDKVLSRGYAMVMDENNKVFTSVDSININQMVNMKLKDGTLKSKVISKEK